MTGEDNRRKNSAAVTCPMSQLRSPRRCISASGGRSRKKARIAPVAAAG